MYPGGIYIAATPHFGCTRPLSPNGRRCRSAPAEEQIEDSCWCWKFWFLTDICDTSNFASPTRVTLGIIFLADGSLTDGRSMTLEKTVLYLTRVGLCVSQFPARSDSQADNRSPDSQYRQSKIGGFRLMPVHISRCACASFSPAPIAGRVSRGRARR